MFNKAIVFGSMLACAVAAAPGCSSSASGGEGTGASQMSTSAASVVVKVPSDLQGKPRQLVLTAFATNPPSGPPAAVLLQEDASAVSAGKSLALQGDAKGLAGDYYVIAVLFMEGGGTMQAKSSVDYQAATATKVTFADKPVDVGTLTLALAR